MSNGIVVDHRESKVRFAISEENFNENKHRKVRDLNPGETVRGYQPRRVSRLGEAETSVEDSSTAGSTTGATATAKSGKEDSSSSSKDKAQ